MLDIYTNLIPVILISMLILYEENVANIANTPLGKIIAILLIIYYTSVDIIFGLFMCALIVLYYNSDYLKNVENFTIQSIDPVVKDFKDQYCKNGTLMNKGSPVNIEMLEHIHSDINFKYEKCDPCSDTCDFSIIEEQIKVEENIKPKTSDDFSINKVFEKVNEFATGFIPALWVKSEPFMLL